MKYKTILRVSDVVSAIEDWKREMITEDELAQAFLSAYNAIKQESEVLIGNREKALNGVLRGPGPEEKLAGVAKRASETSD